MIGAGKESGTGAGNKHDTTPGGSTINADVGGRNNTRLYAPTAVPVLAQHQYWQKHCQYAPRPRSPSPVTATLTP